MSWKPLCNPVHWWKSSSKARKAVQDHEQPRAYILVRFTMQSDDMLIVSQAYYAPVKHSGAGVAARRKSTQVAFRVMLMRILL